MTPEIARYKLDTAFVSLQKFDHCAKLNSFMEVSVWFNSEGFDVHLSNHVDQSFRMTWGEFKALKKLIKELDG